MDNLDWRERFDRELDRVYGITIEDAGLDERDLRCWAVGYEEQPEQAAAAWGEHADLDPLWVWQWLPKK